VGEGLRLPGSTTTLQDAVDSFLDHHDLARSTRRVYRASLASLVAGLGPATTVGELSGPMVAGWFRSRYAAAAPATWNREPIFLGDRRPTRGVAGLDLDPTSGRARLSHRRAAELFRVRTGWTLHQLRHSALTHAAEDGTNLPLLPARSRHASVRSLERYARPGPEAVARHLAETDPARRRP
jgi:hypothetical protein